MRPTPAFNQFFGAARGTPRGAHGTPKVPQDTGPVQDRKYFASKIKEKTASQFDCVAVRTRTRLKTHDGHEHRNAASRLKRSMASLIRLGTLIMALVDKRC